MPSFSHLSHYDMWLDNTVYMVRWLQSALYTFLAIRRASSCQLHIIEVFLWTQHAIYHPIVCTNCKVSIGNLISHLMCTRTSNYITQKKDTFEIIAVRVHLSIHACWCLALLSECACSEERLLSHRNRCPHTAWESGPVGLWEWRLAWFPDPAIDPAQSMTFTSVGTSVCVPPHVCYSTVVLSRR